MTEFNYRNDRVSTKEERDTVNGMEDVRSEARFERWVLVRKVPAVQDYDKHPERKQRQV